VHSPDRCGPALRLIASDLRTGVMLDRLAPSVGPALWRAGQFRAGSQPGVRPTLTSTGLRRQCFHRSAWYPGEVGVPAVKVLGELVVEDSGADLNE
jgi:hypothetical protein